MAVISKCPKPVNARAQENQHATVSCCRVHASKLQTFITFYALMILFPRFRERVL